MKAYTKRKEYRRNIHKLAAQGYINDSDGKWIQRAMAKECSMRRDYYPQQAGA